ncbi:MAG TPA: sialidase family protein [Candidatus Thermoplasmatota archaeon]|nr:sialidase family protein [Candidatus Thermoplasmatota archaeon]
MRPALLVVFLLLSGCLRVPDLFRAPDVLAFEAPVAVSSTQPGAEPVIAVAPDGTIYVEGIGSNGQGNVNKLFRSDDGRSWSDVTPPALGQERSNDGYLAVDDGGNVYVSNVFSLTLALYKSTDEGATWTRLNVPPVPALMHRHWLIPVNGTLHLTMEAFPPSYAPYLARGPPLPTDLSDRESGMWYTRSADGGATWEQPRQIDPIVNFAGQTNMVTSADGSRLYVGRYQEDGTPPTYTYDDGHWYLLASDDAGDHWERREMFDLTSEMSTAVPGLALADDGALWLAWSQQLGNSSIVHLAGSRDGGRTWSAPTTPVGTNGTHAMAWARGAPDGAVGLMWYQADVEGTASKVDASWSVHYAILDNGTVTSSVRVTPTSVHEGNICAKGPACAGQEDRSLLDYPWMDFGKDGTAWLVFPSTQWERPSAFAVVAHQK